MDALAYVDGDILELDAARVPLTDRGYLLGDGVFETLRTARGTIFRPDAHRRRLQNGLVAIGLDNGLVHRFDEALAALHTAGTERFGGDLYLRINITAGPMQDIVGTASAPAVSGIVRPFRPYPEASYINGLHLATSRMRLHRDSPLAGVKTLSFLPYVLARREAAAAGADDAVLHNDAGRIAEASTSNLFVRRGDTVHAPGAEEGAVAGVTRDVVLELIDDAGLEVVTRMEPSILRDADEAWISNTTGGVVPVTRVDAHPISDGRPGALAARLGDALAEAMA